MWNRRAERIRTLVAIVVIGFLVLITPASASQERRELAPGISYIRITSQVIKQDKHGHIRFAASALYNKHISPYAIGNSVARCAIVPHRRTIPNGSQICTIVYRMPLGQITAVGFIASEVYYTIPVVGGTGYYRNIGGQVQSITTRLVPHKENLIFSIVAFKEG